MLVLRFKHLSVWGGLDCIPASPHGYAENRDFDFLKNLKSNKISTLYDTILAYYSNFVKQFHELAQHKSPHTHAGFAADTAVGRVCENRFQKA